MGGGGSTPGRGFIINTEATPTGVASIDAGKYGGVKVNR